MKTLGFIGSGNMSYAMQTGILTSNLFNPKNIYVYDHNEPLMKRSEILGVCLAKDIQELARKSDIIVLAIKPSAIQSAIDSIKDVVDTKTLIISVAAGYSISKMQDHFESPIKVVRAMPNTPALIKEGMSAISFSKDIDTNTQEQVIEIFSSFSKVEVINEELMDVITAISGSSPAYVFIMIKAMVEFGKSHNLSEEVALKLATQSVLGAAKMILETKTDIQKLIDQVTSPGGTTQEALKVLEEEDFESILKKAMEACAQKSKNMTE